MINIKTFFATALALLVQSVAAKDMPEGMRFAHLDWTLICDNTRACNAVGSRGLQDWLHRDMAVLLSRKAGPGEQILVKARFVDRSNTRQEAASMLVDGKDFGFLDGPDSDGDYQLSASQVQSLLPVLVGRYSGIVFKNSNGTEWPLSVDGAAAVLLKMDEVQGRIGTPGAVMRKGSRPEQSVLPPILAPLIKQVAFGPRRHGDSSLAFAPEFRKEFFANPKDHHYGAGARGQLLSTEQLSKDKVLVTLGSSFRSYWVANNTPPYDPQLITENGRSHDRRGEILSQQFASQTGGCTVNERWTWDGVSFVRTSMVTSGKCAAQNDAGNWKVPLLVTRIVH